MFMPLFELPVENNTQHPNFELRGGGEGVWIALFCEVSPFKDNVSTILSSILVTATMICDLMINLILTVS